MAALCEPDEVALDGGGAGGILDESYAVHAGFGEIVAQDLGFGVAAADAKHADCCVQGQQVQGEVGSATREGVLLLDMEDRHWCIGGEPGRGSLQQLIEHEIAHNDGVERLPVGESGEQGVHVGNRSVAGGRGDRA